jgi:DNA repair protein RAD57
MRYHDWINTGIPSVHFLMDLLSTLPDFPAKSYSHILPTLEKVRITTTDLLCFDALEIAKRARVPVTDVRTLTKQVVEALHKDLGLGREGGEKEDCRDSDTNSNAQAISRKQSSRGGKLDLSKWSWVSTLDPMLDAALAGGISTGYVTEITGER